MDGLKVEEKDVNRVGFHIIRAARVKMDGLKVEEKDVNRVGFHIIRAARVGLYVSSFLHFNLYWL